MRIAYIVLKGMPLGGGIEKYTEEIGSRLAERGHDIIVYTMKHYGANGELYRGMRIINIPTLKTKSLEKIIASFIATLYQCFERNLDIVHFHAFGPAMFSIIPRLLGRKVVVQGHGLEWKRSRWKTFGRLFLKFTEIPSVKFPHIISVVSKVQQRYIREKYEKESVYIPTGVNPPQIQKPELIRQRYKLQGNDYILFVARLVREKGAHYLIEAYKRINTSLKLVIAGDAKHEEVYRSELLKLSGGNNNIIFTGFVTGQLLNELFSNSYIFVLPSIVEGLPTVLLEAMSYGNCCLVSDIEENLEALNGHGYTFRNKDVDDLCVKLNDLISDPGAVQSVKEPAKEYVLTNYSWENIASRFEEIYGKLLN
ncbi:MAG: glycosyltransferase family 4 protein [Candidatus Omnitrophica bacterium]|nr:glycosyltransferase family 4 protein [Candidatus Omnitrophota bacterium]